MKRSHRIPALLGTAASAAVLALAPGVAAQGATTTGWRLVFTRHYGQATNFSGYLTGVATGKNHAWAFGSTDLSGATSGSPRAERWNGTAWRGSALPTGLSSVINAGSATSASNVWAVTQFGGDILHWNGSGWSVAKDLTGSGQLTGVTAISTKDVWVFGGGGFTGGLGTWHFNGQSWTHITGTATGLEEASAVSASDIWGIGSVSSSADSIMRFNGSTWRRLTAKALSGLQFADILAKSSKSVWATATVLTNSFAPRLLHHTSNGWSKTSLPWSVDPGRIARDGRGGLWLTAFGKSGQSWIIHRSASGNWRRTQVIAGTGAAMFRPVHIPGTTSLWSFGLVEGTSGASAAIWGHGSAAG